MIKKLLDFLQGDSSCCGRWWYNTFWWFICYWFKNCRICHVGLRSKIMCCNICDFFFKEMTDFEEQWMRMKFCSELGKNSVTYNFLNLAFREERIRTQVFVWCSKLKKKIEKTSVENSEHLRCSVWNTDGIVHQEYGFQYWN